MNVDALPEAIEADPEPVTIASFTVRGEPISKARARFTNKGGKVRSYTPEKTMDGEHAIAASFLAVAPAHTVDPLSAYRVEAKFYNGTRQRRDVDNMLKLILDGLNKTAWEDDNQVTEVTGQKILTTRENARTEVSIIRVGIFDRRLVNCERCGTEYPSFPSQAGRRFCTLTCYRDGQREKRARTCETCATTFYPNPGSKARFCSVACKSAAGRQVVDCATCGTAFSKQTCHVADKNFCSTECQQASMGPIKSDRPNGECSTCGGPTSKLTYKNCQACSKPGVTGNPTFVSTPLRIEQTA